MHIHGMTEQHHMQPPAGPKASSIADQHYTHIKVQQNRIDFTINGHPDLQAA